MCKTKVFRNLFRFVSIQKRFVLFRINFLCEEFYFVLKSMQFRFVVRSKLNRERLDSSHVTNQLYMRAPLRTPSSHLPSAHQFSKDYGINERQWKYFKKNLFRFELFFYIKISFRFDSLRFAPVKFVPNTPINKLQSTLNKFIF